MTKRSFVVSAVFTACLGIVGAAHAQDKSFPTRAITLNVNFSPGGGTDYEARVMAKLLPKFLGVPVIVKNVPGGGGTIGASLVYRAKPDGYTLLISTMPHFLVLPELMPGTEVQYSVDKFEWLAKAAGNPLVLVVSAKSPMRSFDDFVAEGRKKTLHFGSSNIFSVSYAPTMLLGDQLDLKLHAVLGYRGAAPAAVALAQGELDFGVLSPATWRPYVASGDVRGLLIMGTERVPGLFPDVPTALELGYPAVAALGMTYRMYAAPPGTPKDRVEILADALQKASHQPEFIKAMERAGLTVAPEGAEGVHAVLTEAKEKFNSNWEALKPHMAGQ